MKNLSTVILLFCASICSARGNRFPIAKERVLWIWRLCACLLKCGSREADKQLHWWGKWSYRGRKWSVIFEGSNKLWFRFLTRRLYWIFYAENIFTSRRRVYKVFCTLLFTGETLYFWRSYKIVGKNYLARQGKIVVCIAFRWGPNQTPFLCSGTG